jgi:acetyltransferase-like isoleucine patch superfamily enzyme
MASILITLLHKIVFHARHWFPARYIRAQWYRILGMEVGSGTLLPAIRVSWPHQVRLGSCCIVEQGVVFKYDGPWQQGPRIRIGNNVFLGAGVEFNIQQSLDIGNDSRIASGCRFIDHDHGIRPNALIRAQPCQGGPIVLEGDIWLGANVVVLKGVRIGCGAVIGAGAVVTKSVPPGEIWLGVPARKVSTRSCRT